MNMYTVPEWILFFYIYSFFGWIFECVYCSIHEKKLINRGFMSGPFLPLYGFGAVGIIIITLPIRGHVILMSLCGMVSAGLLEYVTGYVMERLFKVKYWDYTGRFLNVHGYICFASVACWGVMTYLVVNIAQVRLIKLIRMIPQIYIRSIVFVITPCMAVDFVMSFHAAMRLREFLENHEKLQEELHKLALKKDELEAFFKEAQDAVMETVDSMIESMDNAVEETMDSVMAAGTKTKDTMVAAGVKTKDTVVAAGVKTKDTVVAAGVKTKDTVVAAGVKTKDTVVAAGVKTKDTVVAAGTKTRDTVMAAGSRTRESAAGEMQDVLMRMGEVRSKMQVPSSAAIKDLLRRNPTAYSNDHGESFNKVREEYRKQRSQKKHKKH